MTGPIACLECGGERVVPVNACKHSAFAACPLCGPDEMICDHCAYTPGVEPCERCERAGAVVRIDGEFLCAADAATELRRVG